MAPRVLVVDDVAEMRDLIRRALSASDYQVDVAGTLSEAWGMDPAGYDVVIVDAKLGSERGTDLIQALRSRDQRAASRCLIITGGAVDMLPDGVASLAKPFQLEELLGAVRALDRPNGTAGFDHDRSDRSDQYADVPAGRSRQRPAAVLAAGYGPAAGEARVRQLLGIVRRLRARDRRALAEFLHDGPVQELTAARLELQLISRSGPSCPASHLESVLRQIDAASRSLRWLVDGPWPLRPAESTLTEAIRQRTAWLLAAPATVDADMQAADPGALDAPLIADVVELMLLATEPAGPAVRAHLDVRMDQQLIQIDLTLASGLDDEMIGDPAATRASLDELASALGASVHTEFSERQWRVCLAAAGWTA